MINPWYVHIIVFCISLVTYTFSWSFLYPAVSIQLLLFFVGSFLLNFLVGSSHKGKFVYNQATHDGTVENATRLICFLWSLEFAYHGGIPLLKVLSGVQYDYTGFGIPTLSVFTFTFTSFLCVYSFHLYLSTKSKKYLIFWLINLLPGILIVSRGTFLVNVASCMFVYLLKRFNGEKLTKFSSLKRGINVSLTNVFYAALLVLFISFSFGYVGNIRNASAFNMDRDQSDALILQMGGATENFIESPIPKEFFWSYLYISSPLANLQYNIDYFQSKSVNILDTPLLIIDAFTPDFIAKRINEWMGRAILTTLLITPEMTVPTIYTKSFIHFSWIGMFLMAGFMLIFPKIYLNFLPKESHLYVSAIAILNTMYFFMIFDNMFTFSGVLLQLLYPIILRKHIASKS
jgi:hypothetical protein